MLKTRPVFGAFVRQRVASDRTGNRSGSPTVRLRSGLAPLLIDSASGVPRGVPGLSARSLSRWVDMTSGGADVDQKIQQLKRVQEGEEDCDTKRRKADVEPSSEDRRFPKKKVALLLAYSGKGYYGMQVPTPAGLGPLLTRWV